MFLQNSYTTEYFLIIEKYKKEQQNVSSKKDINGYCEKHHIIPKSLGGNNNRENLVFLSAKDHFKCHQLLVLMTEGESKSKMWSGLWRMMNKQSKNQERDYVFTEDDYEEARINHSITHSHRLQGENNYFYNKKHSAVTIKKMSDAKRGKSYEEIFGEEGGKLMRERRRKETLGKRRSDETCEKIRNLKLGKQRPDILKRAVKNRKDLYLKITNELSKITYYRGMFTQISSRLSCDKELVSKIYKNLEFYKQLLNEITE